jgi:hypothetical protein
VVADYAGALDRLHEQVAPGRLVAAPGGYVAGSVTRLPGASPGPWSRFGLAVCRAGPQACAWSAPVAQAFGTGLLDLHRTQLRDALEHTMRHLGVRSSGDTSLLGKQLIQAQVAECALDICEDEAMPAQRRGADTASRWRSYRRLVTTGRRMLRLLGASGFLAESPAVDLHLAELTGGLYLHPGTASVQA